ncbi:hypothetical protein ACLK1Y_07065 [Escherichia coli]
MNDVEASLAGPKRPQDRVALAQVPHFNATTRTGGKPGFNGEKPVDFTLNGETHALS